jgi:hypothetical protein
LVTMLVKYPSGSLNHRSRVPGRVPRALKSRSYRVNRAFNSARSRLGGRLLVSVISRSEPEPPQCATDGTDSSQKSNSFSSLFDQNLGPRTVMTAELFIGEAVGTILDTSFRNLRPWGTVRPNADLHGRRILDPWAPKYSLCRQANPIPSETSPRCRRP